jgi:hypothetical protein
MDLTERSQLVRELRFELKQERISKRPRTREAQLQGYRTLNRVARVQARAGREVDRATASAGRAVEGAYRRYSAWETRRLRRMNMRNAERIRTEGYDISDDFRRRSAAVSRESAAVDHQRRAGTGVNRWRGSVRQAGEVSPRLLEQRRTAAILAARRNRTPVSAQDPFSYDPPRRERRPRAHIVRRRS